MKAKWLFFIVSAALLFQSCDNKTLSRGEAKKLIMEHWDYPRVEIKDLQALGYSIRDTRILLVEKDLIVHTWGYDSWAGWVDNDAYTEKALPFVYDIVKDKYIWGDIFKSRVITHCTDFHEITGIVMESETKAKVQYTYKMKGVTPFGEAFGFTNDSIIESRVYMTLYDDGWRVSEDKPENIKPETYPFFTKNGDYIP